MDSFIGQVVLFAGTFAPRGWTFCEGQLLQVSQSTSLFAVIGSTYGGDGRSTFALPDLRGRAPLQPGNGAGLPSVRLGQQGSVMKADSSTPQMGTLGLNYIICLSGIFPIRS